MIFKNKTYDILKWTDLIFLPASGTLYLTVSGIWGLGGAQQVVSTIVALTTFLGVILGLSTASYNKSDEKFEGELNFKPNPETGEPESNFVFNRHPNEMSDKKEVTFKVNTPKK